MTAYSFFHNLAQSESGSIFKTPNRDQYLQLLRHLKRATVCLNWCGHRIVKIDEHILHLKDLLNLIANQNHFITPFARGIRWDPDLFPIELRDEQYTVLYQMGRLFTEVERQKTDVLQGNTLAKIVMIVCLFFQTGRVLQWGSDIPNSSTHHLDPDFRHPCSLMLYNVESFDRLTGY